EHLTSRIAESAWIRNHPDEARELDDFLRQLSNALVGVLDTTGLDKREAGYLLALDEHAFDGSTIYTKALSGLGVELSEIAVVDAPYPPTMETYSHGNGTIIVSENVGPYNRLRSIARNHDDALAAFGFAPSAVVLGNGRFATHPRFVADVLEQAQLPQGSRLLYWGDLDREGLSILAELASGSLVCTCAWAQPYHAMLEAARHKAPRASRDQRGILPDFAPLEMSLSTSDLALAQRLIKQGAIVPQEAVRPEAYRDGSFA
ncbi:MAG: DUF2220 family protein, partial [Coriobacteriales bacterium]|nr:DUF2220 family protein [Coriobacteriales bacterium]